jgi:GNAT superfamily N-acetyltransferase
LLAYTTTEDTEVDEMTARNGLRAVTDSGVRVRQMCDADLARIMELRSIVRWSTDPRAFDLLRGVRSARWAVAEAPDGDLTGMVGAVPLGDIGILCHLAVHDGYRSLGLGALLVTVPGPAGCRAHDLMQEFGFEGTEDRLRMELGEKTADCRSSLVHYGTTPYLAT